MYYLGIDGGGTKTTALVCDDFGSTVIRLAGESINFRSVGLEEARMNMSAILKRIEAQTGIGHFRSVFIGMSALSGKAAPNELKAFCDGVFDADVIDMNSDVYIALAACEDEAPAVAICGTGSMAAAVKDGKVLTKGGFGYLLGDEGSAYAIASDGLKAAVRASENVTEKTLLTERALAFFGAESVERLLDIFYDPPMPRAKMAQFAAEVTKCAAEGDRAADGILKNQAESFALTVTALLKELEKKPKLYLFGGVFEHDEIFTAYFSDAVKENCTGCELLKNEPVYGAVQCALKLVNNN